MNNKQIEKLLLLRESGEITNHDQKRLVLALAGSKELLNMERDVKALQFLWKEAAADAPLPSDAVMERIRREVANTLHPQHPATFILRFPLPRHAAACAAAMLILAAGLLVTWRLTTAEQHSDFAAVDALDASILKTLDEIDASLHTALSCLSDNGNPPEVERDALALQLMILEDS